MGRRVVISLDPEYVPWENTDDSIVRLRRKKRPGVAIAFALLVPVVIAAAVFALPHLQQTTDSTPPPTVEEVADGQPTPAATVPPTPTPDLFAGRAGSLGLRFGDASITFFPCNTYTVTLGAAPPQRGDTHAGPVVLVERYPVEVWCDTGTWILEE
jgi:hypothetical protein